MSDRRWKTALKNRFEQVLFTKISSVSLFEDTQWEELVVVCVMEDGQVRVFRSNLMSDDSPTFWELREDRTRAPRIDVNL